MPGYVNLLDFQDLLGIDVSGGSKEQFGVFHSMAKKAKLQLQAFK